MNRLAWTLAALVVAAPAAADKVVLQNDRFSGMGGLDFGGQLVKGEGVGATFTPSPEHYPFRILGVHLMAGPSGAANLKVTIHEDTGSVEPGKELGSVTESVDGNSMFIQEIDLMSPVRVTQGKVRVTVFPDVDTAPNGVAIPFDRGSAVTNASTLCVIALAPPCAWNYASMFVNGTWIVRLSIDTEGALPDGGVPPGNDGGVVPGGAPVVESITPASMQAGAGGRALIRGSNFVAGAPSSKVTLDGDKGPSVLENVLVEDDRTITVQIPAALAQGVYAVVVQNPDGRVGRLAMGFTVNGGGSAGGCGIGAGSRRGAGLPGGQAVLVLVLLLAIAPALRVRRRPRFTSATPLRDRG